jgi:capsular polysaccharide biosynthesis protein
LLYVHQREEARISGALDQRGILNVAMAEQPVVSPVPSRSPLGVALLTLFLGGTFSLSTAFALDFMDRSFHTPDQVTAILGIPVVVAMPKRIA